MADCWVMHHTFGIIGDIKEQSIIKFVEVEFVTFFDVLPVDFYILVPIRALMHMVHSQSMDEFMNNSPTRNICKSYLEYERVQSGILRSPEAIVIRVKIQWLGSTLDTQFCPASSFVSISLDNDIVLISVSLLSLGKQIKKSHANYKNTNQQTHT